MPGRYKSVRRLALCQGQRSCRAKKKKKEEQTQSNLSLSFVPCWHLRLNPEKDRFPQITPFQPPRTVPVLTSTYAQIKKKTPVNVIERSRDGTPRSKYDKSEGHTRSPCASNLVQFQLLFTKLRQFEKQMAHPISFYRPPF